MLVPEHKARNGVDMDKPLLNRHSDVKWECGTDEVGRGCLAGPVVAAAVILPDDFYHPKLRDSKKMTGKARNEVYDYIIAHSIAFGIAQVSVEVIESINILNASMEAMHAAIRLLDPQPEFILVDGNQFKDFTRITGPDIFEQETVPHICIVRGDNKYASIAAASVLAKVSRDRLMWKLSEKHPGYGWETNVGYGTKAHIEAIKERGITSWHRQSFLTGILSKSTKLF